MVVKSERIPGGGETVLGGEFVMVAGRQGRKPGRLRGEARR